MATCSMSSDAVDEVNDPGAAPYGNFINYYTFNPPENRLSLIPATLLQDLGYSDGHQTTLILDVGCNSGVGDSGTKCILQMLLKWLFNCLFWTFISLKLPLSAS